MKMKRNEKVNIGDLVRKLLIFNLETNVYSAITRGLIDAILLDLSGQLQVYQNKKKERKRKTLEDLITFYSREVSKLLHNSFKKPQSSNPYIDGLLKEAYSWVKMIYEISCKLFDIVFLINMETMTRLSINTKNPYMPLEIGLSWHPYFNLPYIPSSALKGVARSYFELNKVKVCDLDYSILFGKDKNNKGSKGILIFHDALPYDYKDSLIDIEIVNPHYSEVEGRIDEISVKPRPLVYPVIAPNVKFATVIAVDMSSIKDFKIDHVLFMKELEKYLIEALSRGIGARVSLGYGFMRINITNIGGRGVKYER